MAGMTPAAFKRNLELREILRVNAALTQENQTGTQTGPVGPGYSEVRVDPDCNPALVRNARDGAVSQPLAGVHVTGGAGGFSQLVHHAAPVGGAGPFRPERQESTTQSRTYLSLVDDEFNPTQMHILEYEDGNFVRVRGMIDFLSGPIQGLAGAIPIRNDNSIVFLRGNEGFEIIVTRIFVPSADFVEGKTDTGGAVSGTSEGHPLFLDGDFIFAAAPNTGAGGGKALFRFNYPAMDGAVFIDQINAGAGNTQDAAIWTPDRMRVPRKTGGSYTGLDHVFLDPEDGFPNATADIIFPEFGRTLSFPPAPGFFYHGTAADSPIKIGEVQTTGSGVDLGWPQTWLEADFSGFARLVLSASEKFVTGTNIYAPGATGDLAGRFATAPWNGGAPPATLPVPIPIDYITPEAVLGFTPGADKAFPAAWLPWF